MPVSFSGLAAIKYYGGQCIRQIIKLAKGFARHCPPYDSLHLVTKAIAPFLLSNVKLL
ncbi:MAG: hypothetical protein F6J98_00085 [Moorea sp. SIO4G2]|nr:hypothetical protein [Moorena sp. SIO4G2]